MKKIGFLFWALVMIVSLVVGGSFYFNSEKTSAEPSDSILYNKYYKYTTNEINFFIKERGYDFVEKYDDEDVQILKKELLVGFMADDSDFEYLNYEIYEEENLLIRGILYPEGSYYYSNLVMHMQPFEEKLKIKILDEKNTLIYDFEIREGEN